ncbi:hypothetical protein [Microvirga splendida]|uniref:EF-hand domain-containing protein n=1 Tax=Microvirga splendida TaxID=2795727 RepID=A0ABS0Y460_9HYPH|nr:hypothetical protein [Microvirga splendida]MBJ6127073.1 hypothetical protein [Microvirga splendida]
MKRIITGLLGGVAMLGMVSVAHAQFGFGLFDANRDTFVNPVEFGTGLDRGGLFGGDGLFDFFDNDDDGFLGLNEIEDRDEVYFTSYDANRDGYLGRNEYYRGMFDVYDANNDFLLDNNEFGLFGSDLGLF